MRKFFIFLGLLYISILFVGSNIVDPINAAGGAILVPSVIYILFGWIFDNQ
jgi:hypothetical protein